MPDPFERHARTSYDWGTPRSRKQQRTLAANDDPLKAKAPAKKDPNWCKPGHGPHKPVIVFSPYGHGKTGCQWKPFWVNRDGEYEPGWSCYHEERCENCGKHLRLSIPKEECPDWNPVIPDEVVTECRKYMDRRERWRRPRVVIDGPQGYRKKRS